MHDIVQYTVVFSEIYENVIVARESRVVFTSKVLSNSLSDEHAVNTGLASLKFSGNVRASLKSFGNLPVKSLHIFDDFH